MATAEEIAAIFPEMVERFDGSKATGVNTLIQFDLSGDNGGKFWLKITDGAAESGTGEVEGAQMTLKANSDDWYAIVTGEMNAMTAFMSGKLKVQGDMGLAMKMQSWFF